MQIGLADRRCQPLTIEVQAAIDPQRDVIVILVHKLIEASRVEASARVETMS